MADPETSGERTNQPVTVEPAVKPAGEAAQPKIELTAAAPKAAPVKEIPPGKPVALAPDPAAEQKPTAEAKPPVEVKPAIEAAKPPELAAPDAAKVVPDKYELKAPEGIALDAGVVDAISPVFKELGLTAAAAQKLADAFIAHQKDAPARMLTRDLEVTMKDPVLGGLNYGKTAAAVNRALAAFTTPAFRTWLTGAGIANNLEFVRVFRAVGEAMGEDTPAVGGAESAPPLSMADRIYAKKSSAGAN